MPVQSPKISVIIPAYNAFHHIAEALDSVSDQTMQPYEIVVVDDGSTDGTAGKVLDWTKSSSIKLNLIQQKNAGVSAARNRAIGAATGQLLALLDADDVLCPNHHAMLSAPFVEHSQVAVSFADQTLFDGDRIIAPSFLDMHMPADISLDESSGSVSLIRGSAFKTLLNGNYIPTSGSMIAREFANKAGGYDLSLATSEDREFLLRLACFGRFAFTKATVANKRVHETSLTGDASDVSIASNAYSALRALKRKLPGFSTTADDRTALIVALDNAARNLFYSSSRQGLRVHLQQIKRCSEAAAIAVALHPKMMLRAVASSLGLI